MDVGGILDSSFNNLPLRWTLQKAIRIIYTDLSILKGC